MSKLDLLRAVASTPANEAVRRVLADFLLEQGDPRGELMNVLLGGQRCDVGVERTVLDQVRDAVPWATEGRIEYGLVVWLAITLGDVPLLDETWLADEPLAVLAVSVPTKEERVAALRAAAVNLTHCRGFVLGSRIDAEAWPDVREVIEEAEPELLGLDLAPDVTELPEWSFVKLATLSGPNIAGVLRHSLPNVTRLALRDGPASLLEPALAIASLRHLDIRGMSLDDENLAALRTWLEGEGRSVRHERFELGPPDLDDVFGRRGLAWDSAPPLHARAATTQGNELTFVCARGANVQAHVRDAPTWRRRADAEVSAVAATADSLLMGRADGVIERWVLEGETRETVATLPGAVTAIHTRGESIVASHADGWWTSEGETGADPRPQLVPTAEGLAWADGTRVMRSDGSSIDLGEPVLALADSPHGVVAIAGGDVWRLEAEGPRFLGTRTGGRPVVVARDDCVAWISGRNTATIRRGDETTSVAYPNTYSGGTDEELALADLAAAPDGVVIAALEHGGANLLAPGHAMKADEFPKEPHRRWIFIYNRQILVAD